jgi:uncharacterized protein YbaP (TraB family)
METARRGNRCPWRGTARSLGAGLLAACFAAAAAAGPTAVRMPHLHLAEKDGHRIVLLGTKHVDIAAADYPAPYARRIVREIRSAHAYWGESTVESAAATAPRVTQSPPVRRLRLARATVRGLQERFGRWRGWRHQPCGMVASLYVSWDAVGPVMRGREPPTRILDRGLETIALQAGVPTNALDTPEMSARLDARLEQADAACDLDALVADLPPAQARALHAETREEFLSGDADALEARLGRSSDGAELYAVRERNLRWLAALQRHPARRNFVAVGVGHLYGEGGLLQLLGRKGYRVERIVEPDAGGHPAQRR